MDAEIKEYIDSIKGTEKFKKILEFTKMFEYKKDEEVYGNFEHYLKFQHNIVKSYLPLQLEPDYEYFKKFFDKFLIGETEQIVKNDSEFIDLSKTLHLRQLPMFSGGKGNFLDAYIMMTDGTVYISKMPLHYKGNSGIENRYSLYSALIGSNISKKIGVSTAEIKLAKAKNGYRILSKNFLKANEEIIEYDKNYGSTYISEELEKLTRTLELRQFSQEEINATKFEFLKQEFVAKLIGLVDQTTENSPVVVSVDKEGKKHVKMAPMFDYDYSFHITKPDMAIRKCDDGQSTISSLIKQYKDYPGFKKFAQESVAELNMEELFADIFNQTGIEKFRNYKDDEEMMKFISFVNENLKEAKKTINELNIDERGEK